MRTTGQTSNKLWTCVGPIQFVEAMAQVCPNLKITSRNTWDSIIVTRNDQELGNLHELRQCFELWEQEIEKWGCNGLGEGLGNFGIIFDQLQPGIATLLRVIYKNIRLKRLFGEGDDTWATEKWHRCTSLRRFFHRKEGGVCGARQTRHLNLPKHPGYAVFHICSLSMVATLVNTRLGNPQAKRVTPDRRHGTMCWGYWGVSARRLDEVRPEDTGAASGADLAYSSCWLRVDAKQYYIPQTRTRRYMICLNRRLFASVDQADEAAQQ